MRTLTMTDKEKKLTKRLNNIYDAKVIGTEISDDTMRIYVKAKERRCIDRIKCEFTLENNIINNETRID